jgi:hypothetical protein
MFALQPLNASSSTPLHTILLTVEGSQAWHSMERPWRLEQVQRERWTMPSRFCSTRERRGGEVDGRVAVVAIPARGLAPEDLRRCRMITM